MYIAIVLALMLVLPVGCIAVEAVVGNHGLTALLVAKWFVIWSVGARLSLAGLRQIIQPRYTAEVILGLRHEESHFLVRELGFANLAMGITGLACALFPAWIHAIALCGGVFYALAGIHHALQAHRGPLADLAMVSDLFVAAVLLLAFAAILLFSS
ncbi:hypothetical protein HNP46_003751 [Pseudomonas nitritireducens]|uniref:Uncharacterized protein n=1 Tax=Pseudomonas nitroreducens TaxID=46680 RepID=A0A7W7P2U7_PSENT|nr:DUF6790 family protein [Pseudomonas nitritireducens]MBB4864875.1 hypothetical protein [Pseudomonas nitritireducens]